MILFKALATPAKQTLGPKRAFGDDITNSSKKDLKGAGTPMHHVSFTPRQSSAGLPLSILFCNFISRMSCSGMSSFPKSVSKTSVSASKAAPSQVPDIDHATRGAHPEPCFDPCITKAVALVAASSCAPNNLLAQCRPSTSVLGDQPHASRSFSVAIMSCRLCDFFTDIVCSDAQSLEDLLAIKDLCDTLSFSDDDDGCPPVPPCSRGAAYDFNF